MLDNEDDFFDFEDEDNEFDELVSKFERYVNEGEPAFFDSQDILDLIDYYSGWMDKEMVNKALEIGLQYYPDSSELLLKKAELLANQSYTLEALKLLDQLEPQLKYDPNFYLTRGDIYSQMGLSEQSISEYKKLLDLDYPNKEFVYSIIGTEYMMQDKFEEAIFYLKKSIEYNADNGSVLYKLYFCYSEINKLNTCIDYFKKILDEHPFNSDAWLYLAFSYYDIKDYENAFESINFAQAINPSDLLIILKKSDILKAMRRYDEAIDLLKETIDKEPQNAYMTTVLGETLLEVSDYERSIYYFHKSLYINSKDSRSWLGLGECYAHLSQDSEAISCIQQAIINSQNDPTILFNASKIYILLELYEEAVNILKDLFNKGYDKTEVVVWLSIALEKSGYVTEAVDLLTDQIYNQHNNAIELQYCLAGILLLYQYRQEGLATLEKALQIDSSKHDLIYEFSVFFEDDTEIQQLIQQYNA
ncbi:MAG: hypothetical protein KatS3mg027_0491 [Bacteroidia bacterium]|nr:MAG: hypothetical protein KatS3mg027_0491 [Bacteroidia bacterium]